MQSKEIKWSNPVENGSTVNHNKEARKVSGFPAGSIKMPPSKSISHRAVICAALSQSPWPIENLVYSQDIEATSRCMKLIRQPGALLDCGESGSTLRFLIPLAAALTGQAGFTGQGRLLARPQGPYIEALASHGITLEYKDDILRLEGSLKPGLYTLPGHVSSQFISGLLFALPLLAGESEIVVTSPLQSKAYVDLTIDVMTYFGVTVWHENYQRFKIPGKQQYVSRPFTVEGDFSQAAFFLVASALGSHCECLGLSPYSKQGDKTILDILQASGVDLEWSPQGGVTAKAGALPYKAQIVDIAEIPDLVSPLAAFFCFCQGRSRIENGARLRLKESDRLATVTEELNKLGARITIEGDALVIDGVESLAGGRISGRGDHRIAMMGAVAAVRSRQPVYIEDSGCVAKSYPHFWEDFEKEKRL